MGRNRKLPVQRHRWLAGRAAVLLAIVTVGIVAIVHYSSWGDALAAGQGQPTAAGRAHAARHPHVVSALANAPRPPISRAQAARPGRDHPVASAVGTTVRAAPRSVLSSPSPAASSSVSPPPTPSGPATGASAPLHFRTLPPGAKLPSGAQCAKWVLAKPSAENKGVNTRFNHTTGQHVGRGFFQGDTPQASGLIAPRINGNFTGTTKEILRWAACKWGISQSIVFAQAAVESWWRQTTQGDFGTDPSACPPAHRALNAQGQCAQSYGILQNRYPFEKSSWPGNGRSTAMNADTAYAIWRSCFDGYETWLNTVPRGSQYHSGDAWGCVGRWFAGRWHTAPAQQYVSKVAQYMREKIWTTPDFQQP
jgi:hypothetical protein